MKSRIPFLSSSAPQTQGFIYTGLAVLMFGTSPIFIYGAAPFHSIEIACLRLAIATALVAFLGKLARESLRIPWRELPRFCFYGLITALHFLFYNLALAFTTVAHALALTYTSPIFVALLSTLILKESISARKTVGVIVTIVGIAIMTGFEPGYTNCSIDTGQCMILGDIFALLSALCYGIYSIVGRKERERHPLFRYTTHVYGLAALWLLPFSIPLATQHSYPLSAIGSIFALGILPLGIGHTLYNAAIRKMHATYANLIATQEVTLGIILSVIFLQEIPSISAIIGGLVTLLGIIGVLL